jgi:hypothetical protein
MSPAAAVVVCALALLGRSPNTTVPIVLLDAPPASKSTNVEAFLARDPDTIYLITSSRVFREALLAGDPHANLDAFRKIASIIVHEEWHARNGHDERGAYQAQLTVLTMLGANPNVISDVKRSMNWVLEIRARNAPTDY